jgi:hypothetical protein
MGGGGRERLPDVVGNRADEFEIDLLGWRSERYGQERLSREPIGRHNDVGGSGAKRMDDCGLRDAGHKRVLNAPGNWHV